MTDLKKISLEAAKLLGLPFGWRGYRPHRFVHTKQGSRLQLWVGGWEYTQHEPNSLWLQSIINTKGNPFIIEEEDLESWAHCSKTKKELEDERHSTTGQLRADRG